MYKKLNYAIGDVASTTAIDATTLTLKAGHTITTDTGETNKFVAVFYDGTKSSPYQDTNREIVEAYRTNTNDFVIARAKEGTSAKQWIENDKFMLIASAGVFDEYETELDSKLNLDQTSQQTILNDSPLFSEGVEMSNEKWLKSKNYAGTGDLNILKGNEDDEVDVGAQLNIGDGLEGVEDTWQTLIDMPVTTGISAGTKVGFVIKNDGTNILSIEAEADGAGGIQNPKVKILNKASLSLEDGNGVTHTYTSDTDGSLIIS